MIALAIVAVTLIAVGGLRNRDLLYHDEIRLMTRAALLAQARMAEIQAGKDLPGLGPSSGEFEEPYTRYVWEQQVNSTPFEFAREVALRVRWGEKPHEEVEVISYVFDEKS
jgi:hypothetical protein